MRFSIIIALTEGTSHLLPATLDSILAQDFLDFEIIIIDGQKRGSDILDSYGSKISKVVTAQSPNLFAMMNQGIFHAKGEYINFLLPGEYFLSRHALTFLTHFFENEKPDLGYTAGVVRHSLSEPQIHLLPLSVARLKGGKMPPTLQSFWFSRQAIYTLGKFREFYAQQAGLDLVCRFFLASTLKKSFLRRVLTDYEYQPLSPKKVLRSFFESLFILSVHFGLSGPLLVWFAGSQLRLLSWSWKNVKGAFWKQQRI